MPERAPVYLLAGGRSSRFGSDKARADAGGAPMIVRVARAVAPVASRVRVVADTAGKYEDLGLPTIADAIAGRGPLSGLHAALRDLAGEPWLVVAPCDVPGLSAAWIASLLARAVHPARAVAFRGERWEPLPSAWRADVLADVGSALARGDGAVHRLLDAVRAEAVPCPEAWAEAASCDTPEALAAWLSGRSRTSPDR